MSSVFKPRKNQVEFDSYMKKTQHVAIWNWMKIVQPEQEDNFSEVQCRYCYKVNSDKDVCQYL